MDNVTSIKEKVDIVELIGAHVKLKRSGKNYSGICPFHSEKTASFMVSPEIQRYRCFGCGRSGDIFNFIMELEGVDFADALKLLADRAGIKLERSKKDSKDTSVRQKILKANDLSAHFYNRLLTNHEYGKKVLQYLKNRGITESTIKEFNLGYAPSSWDSLSKLLVSKGFSLQEIEMAGLGRLRGTSKDGTYDMFRGRLMFPLYDHMGKIVGFAGRALGDDQMPKYINTAETPIFHKEQFLFGLNLAKSHIRSAKEAIVVEGEFDMISPYQAGIKNIVASKGTALTPAQVKLLKRYADTAILVFDNDIAGMDASVRGVRIIQNSGLNIKVATLPDDVKDPDDLVKKDPSAFKLALKNAIPLWDFFFYYVSKRFDLSDVFEKRQASEFLLALIKEIDDEVIKSQYIKKFAQVFELEEQAAIAQLKKTPMDSYPKLPAITGPKGSQTDSKSIEELLPEYHPAELYLLTLLTKCDKEKVGIYLAVIESGFFTHEDTKQLFIEMSQTYEIDKKLDFKAFYDKLVEDSSTHKLFENIYFVKGDLDDLDQLDTEIVSAINRLKRIFLKSKIQELSKAIKQAEAVSDQAAVDKFSLDVQEYSQELSELS